MLGTESRSLDRHAHNPKRATRAPDHWPLHRRWVANRTADATLIRPEMLRSVRQIDSLGLENPSTFVPIGRSISRAELPSTTQNWQHCTDGRARLGHLYAPISGKPEISVSFRSHKSARCTRPGHGVYVSRTSNAG